MNKLGQAFRRSWAHPIRPRAAWLALGTLGTFALFCPPAQAQVRPTHRPEIPNFDTRAPAPLPQAVAAGREQAKARLTTQLPAAVIDFDGLLDTPKFIRSSDGFLTGPNGQGGAVSTASLLALPSNEPFRVIKAFLNDHADLFGHDAHVLDTARVKRDYVDAHNGLHTVVWEQQLDGIPVYGSTLMGHITRNGELTSLSSFFVPNAAAGANAATPNRAALEADPPISATQAIVLAARNLGVNLSTAEVSPDNSAGNETGYQLFKTPAPAFVRLVWLPLNRSALRLGWEVMVTNPATRERFRLVLDAQNGTAYLRYNMSCYISDVTYNVYTSDSPSPFSPGLQTPGNFQPPLVPRTFVTTAALDTNASPDGWIPDNGTNTTGNNADAFVDRNFDLQPDFPRPSSTNRVFDFPLDLTMDPTNYMDASAVQLFYNCNVYHDRLYQLGFTEAAGNFQQNNFGKGGLGNDNIICYVQAGADVGIANNSMFATSPDGFHGQCFMFVFDFPVPSRDGSLDAEVVFHEMTHGTSWRLVGGGMNLGSLQGDGMGEGWSDFYALCLLSQLGDDPDAAYASGGYASYLLAGLDQNYYYGIRHFPYCTDMRKDPFTFKDIDPAQISPHTGIPRSPLYPFFAAEANEVHHQGEVWCVTLWEVHANLVNRYGWTVGNQLMLQLATDGMKLTPGLPNMLQARDAILLADRIDTGGANQTDIWRGFAKRGFGFSARSPNGNTTAGVVEAFDLPGIKLDHADVLGGNGNAMLDPNECDNLMITLVNNSGADATGVSAVLSSRTPGVLVTQPFSAYPPMPDGSTNVNLTPFTVSVAPTFVCGLPIRFSLAVKSDQGNSTILFSLPTGTTNFPVRFDNNRAAVINDLTTTNSIINVSNVDFALTKMLVSVDISHTYDADLVLRLVAPDGTTTTLSANNGANGQNYGVACAPDSARTTFDDAATTPISAGVPPFLGSYIPDQPLTRFAGKSGTNVNGAWQLQVSDTASGDVGILQCWSLLLIPTVCQDGGGECPGSDLAIDMSAAPEPDIVGANLTYTISVTNNGPSTAKNVSVSQILPSTVTFVSAVSSQGSASQSGGIVTANLGQMRAGGTAIITVVVMPTTVGLITSSASVSSEQTDFDLSNNSIVVSTHVNPPTADLGVGFIAAPSSVFIGGTLNYTMTVTNQGPSVASGVVVTNVIPDGLVLLGETISQGNLAVFGNTVVCTVGTLPSGAVASAVITVMAITQGTPIATATAAANQFDPNLANNSAAATIAVGPAADMVLGISARPNPVVLFSNLTFQTTVTNQGPSVATNVIVSETLPTGAVISSVGVSQGSYTLNGNNLVCNLGSIVPGGRSSVTVVVTSTRVGTLTATANVTAALTDPNLANNSGSAAAQVSSPFVSIVAAGANLSSESFPPADGSIEPGEAVTINLRLQNVGNVANTNLVATLLAGGGVTSPSGPQNYGLLRPVGIPGGVPVSRPFSFTASGVSGGVVTATLQLQDGINPMPPVTYTFTLPTFASFTNPVPITIPALGSGSPYPSMITVSGLTNQIGKVTATLFGLTHTYLHDVNVLLVGPTGDKTLLMSHAADLSAADNFDVTLDDTAAAALPASGSIQSGSWRPAAYPPGPIFSNPAPSGPYSAPAMGTFGGLNPNGTWSLYVLDDSDGDAGTIARGWSLNFANLTPVNQVADVGLSVKASPEPVLASDDLTYTFTITNAGPNGATGVTFSNALPVGLTLVSAVCSQGNMITNGNLLIGNLASVASGASAAVTIVVRPGVSTSGSVTNAAAVFAFETDLHPVDNVASVVSKVNVPVADLALGMAPNAAAAIAGSNVVYTLSVTNIGPGRGLNVVVTDPLPQGMTFVSVNSSRGTASFSGGLVTASLGDLEPGATATVMVTLAPQVAGSFTNAASVFTASSDAVAANNSASAAIAVANPAPEIAAAGAKLVSQTSLGTGTISPGQTVTISFSLINTGQVDTVNLVGTLLASGGVTAPSGPATYGRLVAGGAAVSRSFTFTIDPAASGPVLASLQLQDGATSLGTVVFVFGLPVNSSFTSSGAIIIPDHGTANPYPSSIVVSGLSGSISKATVTIRGLTHGFPNDLSLLLVSPVGRSVLLMSHAGGSYGVTNIDLTFDDTAAGPLPNGSPISTGTYQASRYGAPATFPAPAPAAPYGSALETALDGTNPNGAWSLYVLDDTRGDGGIIANGWRLNLTTAVPVSPPVDLGVTLVSTPPPLFIGSTLAYNIGITNAGPSAAPNVLVTNTLPIGVDIVSASASQGTLAQDGNVLTWSIGTLNVNQGAAATVVTVPFLGGTLNDAVTVTSDGLDLNSLNDSAYASTFVTVPVPARLAGAIVAGQFQLTVTAQPGATYVVETSADLQAWSPFGTYVAPSNGVLTVQDALSQSARFYRAVLQVP